MLDVRVVGGRQPLALPHDVPGFRALSLMSSAELRCAAQGAFAVIADFVLDCVDVLDETLQADILAHGEPLGECVAELGGADFCLRAAFRDTTVVSKGLCDDEPPLSCRVSYMLAGSKDQPPEEVMGRTEGGGGPLGAGPGAEAWVYERRT